MEGNDPTTQGGALEISTCSYAAFVPSMGTAIRISLGGPRIPEPSGREHWIYLRELAPRGWYFKAEPDAFAAAYLKQLDELAGYIEVKLGDLAGQFDRVCLLCWERRVTGPQDCHRRLWAQWWTERTGEEVPELDGTTSLRP
jgi:hypothetical protein